MALSVFDSRKKERETAKFGQNSSKLSPRRYLNGMLETKQRRKKLNQEFVHKWIQMVQISNEDF